MHVDFILEDPALANEPDRKVVKGRVIIEDTQISIVPDVPGIVPSVTFVAVQNTGGKLKQSTPVKAEEPVPEEVRVDTADGKHVVIVGKDGKARILRKAATVKTAPAKTNTTPRSVVAARKLAKKDAAAKKAAAKKAATPKSAAATAKAEKKADAKAAAAEKKAAKKEAAAAKKAVRKD
jgi:predicted phage tail protein